MFTDEAFLDFKCPGCGGLNSYPPDAAGLVRECVHCNENLLVPADGGDTGHVVPLPIKTERLLVRRFAHDDWQSLMGGMFDNEAQATAWVERNTRVNLSSLNEACYLAIEDVAAARIIGHAGLWHDDASFREITVSVTIWEPTDFDKFGAETITGLLKFGFEGLRLHRVIARSLDSEPAQREAITRAGMRCEGEFVKNHFSNGAWHNTLWFAVLEEEYFGAAPASPGQA